VTAKPRDIVAVDLLVRLSSRAYDISWDGRRIPIFFIRLRRVFGWRFRTRAAPAGLLRLSLAASSLLIVPMAFCRSIAPFAFLRVLLGLAVGGAMTLGYTLGGGIIPRSSRAMAYGILSSTAMLGGALGPILCGALTVIDLRATLLIGGLIYLALALHAGTIARRSGAAGLLTATATTGKSA